MRTLAPTTALDRLNLRAATQGFGLEEVDMSFAVDRAKPWSPEGLHPLCFTPGWQELDARARLRLNQLSALALVEKFIWFEQHVVRAFASILRRDGLQAALAQALRRVVTDEAKHIAMFRRLLQRSEPSWYREGGMRLFRPSAGQRLAAGVLARHPLRFLAWIWLGIFVEERALFLAASYRRSERRHPGRIDAQHARVHAYHLLDEVRHCRLDRHLLDALYDPQPAWKKALAAAMLVSALRAYVRGGTSARPILAQLGRELPHLREGAIARILAELPDVADDPRYRNALFGRVALPRTLDLLASYPELAGVRALFPPDAPSRAAACAP